MFFEPNAKYFFQSNSHRSSPTNSIPVLKIFHFIVILFDWLYQDWMVQFFIWELSFVIHYPSYPLTDCNLSRSIPWFRFFSYEMTVGQIRFNQYFRWSSRTRKSDAKGFFVRCFIQGEETMDNVRRITTPKWGIVASNLQIINRIKLL